MRKFSIRGKRIEKTSHLAFVFIDGHLWMPAYPTDCAHSDPNMKNQLAEAGNYRKIIYEACDIHKIEPSIIAGIGSRESRWGLALKPPGPGGTGDFAPRQLLNRHRTGPLPADGLGFGRGLMQIDYDFHEFARIGNWRIPEENINYAIKLLAGFMSLIERKINLDKSNLIRAAVASYNAGPGRIFTAIRNSLDIDTYTSGGNYSIDVLNRAGFFQINGWR